MEFTADQHQHLRRFLQGWIKDDKFELETTFGPGGVVDTTTFLQISQRLRNKGFEAIPQEDRLSILTPSHIRLSLQTLDALQSYCRDDTLEGKAFTAMFKDRTSADSNLDLKDYDIRFKVRREVSLSNDDQRVKDLLNNWGRQKKAFRLIRRWSFLGKGIRVDMSMVRQSPIDIEKGGFQWVTRFQDRNVFLELPRYEVEVELLHDTPYTDTEEKALKALIVGVGEVQRAIQRNGLLIRNSASNTVRRDYAALTGSEKFRGVNPITLEIKNMSDAVEEGVPNIRTGFNVTDKADGLRTMAFVDKEGELFLIDMSMKVYRTGLKNTKCALSLLDGEWVTRTKDNDAMNNYLIFDIYYSPKGENEASKPFVTFQEGAVDKEADSRYNKLNAWFTAWNDGEQMIAKGLTPLNRIQLSLKKFKIATAGDTSIFQKCAEFLDENNEYYTDGLIISSNSESIPEKAGVRWDQQFKWKPAEDNTIDFLINYERNPDYPAEDNITTSIDQSGATVQYKTMRLFVGGSSDPILQNPRAAILNEMPLSKDKERGYKYQPILFSPLEFADTMANTCNITVTMDPETGEEYCVTEHTQEPIPNRSIVEMRYDVTRESGWRWVPYRIRHDKTERLLRAIAKKGNIKYSGTMNDEKTANSVWNSIHNPVTRSMIRSGNEEPSAEEAMSAIKPREAEVSKVYYDSKASKENMALIRGLRDFHNQYIKNDILLRRTLAGGNKNLLDLSCGKGGDMKKWVYDGARYVVGVDIAGDNITNPDNGAYRRYLDIMLERGPQRVPKMAFMIGDSSKRLIDGEAGATSEERNMLRSVFGKYEPDGLVPPYIQHQMTGIYRNGADVAACMFALHYFFENETKLDGFLQNLADTVKVGGYFVGCCFDGERVFNLLRNVERGHSVSGKDGDVPIWTIAKDYSKEELTDDEDSIGLAIDVEFMSIGATHKEYLVPFELLRKKMRGIGFELLNIGELKDIGLRKSTNTFDVTHDMAGKAGKVYTMTDPVKQYSFLNRWFIFKRQGKVGLEMPENEGAQRFGKEITKENTTYELFNVASSSAYSVLKPWHKSAVRTIMLGWFPQPTSVKRIVDATAHIGVDSIHMSELFPSAKIDSFEIDNIIYRKLVNNIITFKKEGIITPHYGDATLWQPPYTVDFLYVDPPWGGLDYLNKASMNLYLQSEKNEPNEEKNVVNVIRNWFDTGKVRNVILKAPRNFNKEPLEEEEYKMQEEPVKNRAGEIAFNLIRIHMPIRAQQAPVEQDEQKAEVNADKADADAEEKEAEDMKGKIELNLGARLPSADRKFAVKEIFRFGIDVDEAPSNVRVKNEAGKPDRHVARWLSLAAPFPIPDPDNPEITYPSVEHYLAGMKLKLASTKPDLAEKLMSTKGAIHQQFLRDRLAQKVRKDSTADFALLAEETKEVRKKSTESELHNFQTTLDSDKWNLMKDKVLMDALRYRWENDRRFHEIVEAAREVGKYLLYRTKIAAAASDLGGERSIKTGRIEGENKVGRYIMELANYQF